MLGWGWLLIVPTIASSVLVLSCERERARMMVRDWGLPKGDVRVKGVDLYDIPGHDLFVDERQGILASADV